MELTFLSWVLLVSDTVRSLAILPMLLAIGSIFGTLCSAMIWSDADAYDREDKEQTRKTMVRWIKTLIVCVAVSTVLASFPSTNTIMMIAGVEMGDDVIRSEEFNRLLEHYGLRGN